MNQSINAEKIRVEIEKALSVSLQEARIPGIVDAELRTVTLSIEQTQHLAAQLELHSTCTMSLSAGVELFLRVSNTDLLSSIECPNFLVRIDADGTAVRATISAQPDWAIAWERGMEPIKQAALQSMRRDVWELDDGLAEDTLTFRAAMVLLASELVGPYADRVATFVGYPLALVQLIAIRLQEAKIWDGDQVRCESWFDPSTGPVAFTLDVMIAEGKLVRSWSGEEEEYAYRAADAIPMSELIQ